MTDATVSRLGQDNLAGDAKALFYKLFTGEVLTAFDKKNVMMARHRSRNITHGKSASFANTGRATGRYHTPGTEITGQTIPHSETVITIDDLLIADVFIANIDEAMNHYEVRGEYSKQLGEALGRTYDKQSFRAAITAARASNKISGLPGGTQISLTAGYAAATDLAKAQELASVLFTAHKKFIENEVPMDGVFCALRPAEYFLLVQNKDLLNKDWGGLGSYAMADLPMVAGIPLVVSNHVPSQDDAANTSSGVTTDGGDVIHSKYAADFSKTKAVIMTPEAIGTVNLLDLAVESAYDIRRQGTLIVAKKLCGTGTLRPECAIEVKLP
jgi:hypothetical protein